MHKLRNSTSRRIVTAFLLAFSTFGCTSLHTPAVRADDADATAQIERRLHEVFDAAEKKDFNRLDGYHFYGPKFTKFTGSSPERLDATAGRKGEHDGLGAINSLKMRADGLKIDVFGQVGIATFILDYTFEAGSKAVQRRDRTTLVFVKKGGDWRITHEHISPITP